MIVSFFMWFIPIVTLKSSKFTMKIKTVKFLLLFVIVLISAFSCKKAELLNPVCDGSNPTYDADIKMIIELNCSGAFCHNAGSNRGDWTTYAGLSDVLINGKFEQRVLISQSMPKGNSRTLTQGEIDILRCWTDNGFPEN